MTLPLVAIVGRSNVGKSTFFNKLAGKRISIVKDTPGVTRDRIYANVEWLGRRMTLIDTGGLDPNSDDLLLKQMRTQAKIAIDNSDLICFFLDGREGLTDNDKDVADILRKSGKPVIPVVNKIDHKGMENMLYEFYEIGLGDPIAISSTNMLGFGDLLDRIFKTLPDQQGIDELTSNKPIQIAVSGRPNVGKSSLTNMILGESRTMVSDIAGTTRDAVDTLFTDTDGTVFNIIDTAGIRKKHVIEPESLEHYSILRAISAIRRCDVALLLIDAEDGVTEQDARIAGIIREEGKASIVVVNKWDKITKETGTLEQYRMRVVNDLSFMDDAPVLFVSALSGQRVNTILNHAKDVYSSYSRRITTGLLNDALHDAMSAIQPPARDGRRLKIYYAVQQGICPPTFVLFINNEKLMQINYYRYIENSLRKSFDFAGTPLRIILREKSHDS